MGNDEMLDYLKDNAIAIRESALAGNVDACMILKAYGMYYRLQESGSLGILIQAIKNWQKSRETVPSLDEIDRQHSARHKAVKLVHPTKEAVRIIRGSEVYTTLLALGYTEALEQ